MLHLIQDIASHQPTQKNTVTVVVFCQHNQTVLLLQRNPHADPHYNDPYGLYWELLGGQVEVGEEPHIAALREVREEIGLAFSTLHLVGISPFQSGGKAASNWIYVAELVQEEAVILSQEHLAWAWTPVKVALAMTLAFKHHAILTSCFQNGRLSLRREGA